MWNQPQDPTLHLFSCLSSCHHLLQYFFGAHPKQVSSLHHPSTFVHTLFNQWPAAFKVHLNTPYSWGHLHQKKISLYFAMVSLMTFSSSSFVFIQFRQGIFNFFASSNRDVLFIYYQLCNPEAGYKSLFGLLFTPQKIHHHLNMLHCRFCASVYLHSSTYIWEWYFYLVCRQNRSLTLPLHSNICRMGHLCHENVFMRSFNIFNLLWMYLPFIGSAASFSNTCDSTSFQIFLYWDTHSLAPETQMALYRQSFCRTATCHN